MNVVSIPLDRIELGDRLRPVDEDYAQLLAASFREDGQRSPIEVQVAGPDGMHRLIAGAHRVRAAAIAELDGLQAVVLKVSDLQAKRLEIEENLIRHDLSALDRSAFLARWKTVYEAINAAVRHGGSRRKGSSGQSGHLIATANIERFTAIASDRMGMSERAIRRATRRYDAIPPDVRSRIAGTWLADHGGELDFLAGLKPDVQRRVVALMQERRATTIKHLRDEVQGIRSPVIDPDTAQFDALIKLWRKTGALARRRFEAELRKDHAFDLQESA